MTKSIKTVLNEHTPNLMSIPEVVGTAQGLYNGKPCIKVFVSKITHDVKKQVPDTIEGYVVNIEKTGMFKAL